MSRAVMSSILSFSGQAKVSRIVVLMVLFGALLGMGWLQPMVADAEVLTATPTTAITPTTPAKNSNAQYVIMSRISVSSTGAGDGLVTLSSITIANPGTSNLQAGRVYISSNGTATTMPSDAVQIGRTLGSLWTAGTTTTILFTGGTSTQRSIFTNTPKYLYIAFDMASAGTTQANVTFIGVANGADSPASGLTSLSNAINVQASGVFAQVTACTDCHGTTLLDNTTRSAATGSFRGSHNKHVDSMSYACASCHVNPTTTGHRNNYINMTSPFLRGGAGGYSKGTVSFPQSSNPTAGTCNTIYCHSSGLTPYTPNVVPTWATPLPTDCTGCHGNDATSAVPMATSEHNSHINSVARTGRTFMCSECHAATVNNTTNRVIQTLSNHVSGSANIKFGPATLGTVNYDAEGPLYAGLTTTGANGAAVLPATNGQCTNVYCHSTGNLSGTLLVPVTGLATYKSPTWNVTAIGCAGCHGDGVVSYPNYASYTAGSGSANSHAKHVGSASLGCSYCHVNTMGTNTAAAPTSLGSTTYHLNRVEDVSFALNGGLTGTYNANKTCSTTYCHGISQPSTTWGGTTQCNSCHDASIALSTGAANTNRHSMHYETSNIATTISTVNGPTTTQYQYGCGNCHDRGQISHATGTNDVKFNIALSGGTPTTGSYTLGGSTATDSRGFKYSYNGQCNTIYCHSTGQPLNGTVSYKTVTWNQAAGTGVNQCSVCHDGLAASAAPIASNKHTFHITSTTYNLACSECHYGTTSTGTTITDKTLHVNGTNNVAWLAGGRNNGADNYTGPNCGNGANGLYCHSRGTSATAPYPASLVSVSWNVTQTLSCAGCHGNSVATLTTGAHAKHLNTSTWASGQITCDDCHNLTAASNSTTALNAATGYANHVNKGVTVALNGTSGGAGATYGGSTVGGGSGTQKLPGSATQTCNTTFCHGGNSQTWATPNNDATCVKCHGVAGSSTASFNGNFLLAAPGYVSAGGVTGVNTSGTFTNTDAKVGAHDAHLRGSNGYKPGGVGCDDCHAVGSLTASGHMDGSTTFVWSNTAKNIGTLPYAAAYGTITPQYGVAGPGSCSTNYCHGGAFIGVVGLVGTDPTPTWNDVSYLPTPASSMDQATCNRCHMSPPTYAGRYDHSSVTFGPGACNACHQHDGNGPTHIDGTLYGAGQCDSCHSYDVDANSDWGFSPKAVEGWGAHATHIRHLKTVSGATLSAKADAFGGPAFAQVCGVCHSMTSNSTIHSMGGQTNVRSINFGDLSTAYSFSTSGPPVYNGVTGTSSAFAAKTCSNVSCHFQATPVWQGY